MKVLTWNVNRASLSRRGVWERLEREDADIVLLQEVDADSRIDFGAGTAATCTVCIRGSSRAATPGFRRRC